MEKEEMYQQQYPLTEEEISALRTKIGKSHHTQKDFDYLRELLWDKVFYTAQPKSKKMRLRYTVEGILSHGGVLLIFTSPEACYDYLYTIGMRQAERYMKIREVSYETVLNSAIESRRLVYIDLTQPVSGKILGINFMNGLPAVYHMKE